VGISAFDIRTVLQTLTAVHNDVGTNNIGLVNSNQNGAMITRIRVWQSTPAGLRIFLHMPQNDESVLAAADMPDTGSEGANVAVDISSQLGISADDPLILGPSTNLVVHLSEAVPVDEGYYFLVDGGYF